MNDIQLQAVRKLREEKGTPGTREGQYLLPFVRDALASFCEQSAAFAEAVMAEGKTLVGCLDSFKVAGQNLSDLEVYRMAAQYFFPEAVIEHRMEIKVPNSQTSAKILDLRFEDLFGGGLV